MTARARGFNVSLFGVRLAIVSDSAAMAEALDRYVLPWLPRAALDGETADRIVEVRCGGDGGGFDVLVDGTVTHAPANPLAAIPPVQRALDEAVVQQQTDIAVVHGGVVGHEGRAILLPGPTGAGKSTLVAELIRQGASYFSDEYALIDSAGRVHPYPRPLLPAERVGRRPTRAGDGHGRDGGARADSAGLILELRYAADAQFARPRGDPGRRGLAPAAQYAPGARGPAVDPGAARARRRGRGLLRRAAGRGAGGGRARSSSLATSRA